MAPFEMLSGAFWRVGLVSMQAVLVVALIVVVQRVFRRALTPRWRYALWGILLMRLLLLWAPPAPWSLFNVAKAVPVPVMGSIANDPALAPRPYALLRDVSLGAFAGDQPQASIPAGDAIPVATDAGAGITTFPSAGAESSEARSWPLVSYRVIALVWVVGAAATLLLLAKHWRRARGVVDAATPLQHGGVLSLLGECCEEAGVALFPRVGESPDVASPMITGLRLPTLLLPTGFINQTSRQQLRLVFLHELTHLRRRDLWWDIAIYGLLIVHWFNPVLWWAVYRVVDDRELACDAAVLDRLTPADRHAYGHTLLDVLQRYREPTWAPGFATIAEKRSLLERRIAMITRFNTVPRWAVTVGVTALAGLAAVSLTNATLSGQTTMDLSITQPDIWASRQDGGEQLVARITNRGGVDVAATVRFFENAGGVETLVGDAMVTIPAAGEAYANVDWPAPGGIHAIVVRIDPDNAVDEADEANNMAIRTISYGNGRFDYENLLTDDLSQYATYVPDPAVLGTWNSVDFVNTPEEFAPGQRRWGGDLYLQGMVFTEEGGIGRVSMMRGATFTFTKGFVLHQGDRTASKYEIRNIDGEDYMFFEWKSGDVTIRHRPPKYYVLERDASSAVTEHERHKQERIDELLLLGKQKLGGQDYEAAMECFEQVLLIEPGNPRAQEGLHQAVTGNGPKQAVPDAPDEYRIDLLAEPEAKVAVSGGDQASAYESHPGYAVFGKAEKLYQQGKLAEAIPLYRQVYDNYSDWNYAETALMMIGIIKARQGFHEESVQWLERAVREYGDIAGWSETTWYYLGEEYLALHKVDDAANAFRKAIRMLEGSGQTGHFAYRGSKERLRGLDYEGLAPAVSGARPAETSPSSLSTIEAKVGAVAIGSATREDVVRVFGEPTGRVGECLVLAGDVQAYMPRGVVEEIRFESGKSGYKFRGRIGVGSTLDDVVAELGPPSTMIDGRNDFEDGVLYRDIGGSKGYCYYARADQGVRMFFSDYKVKALYLTR